jgi:hypothetical protein
LGCQVLLLLLLQEPCWGCWEGLQGQPLPYCWPAPAQCCCLAQLQRCCWPHLPLLGNLLLQVFLHAPASPAAAEVCWGTLPLPTPALLVLVLLPWVCCWHCCPEPNHAQLQHQSPA